MMPSAVVASLAARTKSVCRVCREEFLVRYRVHKRESLSIDAIRLHSVVFYTKCKASSSIQLKSLNIQHIYSSLDRPWESSSPRLLPQNRLIQRLKRDTHSISRHTPIVMTSAESDKDGESALLLCAICQEPAQPEDNRVRLHCTRSDSEMYHANCLSKYLKANNCKFRYGGASDRKVGYACPAHPKCRVRNTNTIPANRARRKQSLLEPVATSDNDGVDPPAPPAAAPAAPAAPARDLAPTEPESNDAKTAGPDLSDLAPVTKTVRVLNAGRLPSIPRLPVDNISSSGSSPSSGSGGTSDPGNGQCGTAASAPDLASMAAKQEADVETVEHACFGREQGDSRASFKARAPGSSKGHFPKQPAAWMSPNHTKSKILSVARAPNPWTTRPTDRKKKSLCMKGKSGKAIRTTSSSTNRAKLSPVDQKERKFQVDLDLPVPEPLTPVNGTGTAAAAARHSSLSLQKPEHQHQMILTASASSVDTDLSGNSTYCTINEEEESVMVVPVAWVQPTLDRSSAWAAGPPPSGEAYSQHSRLTTDNNSSLFLPGKAAEAADSSVSPFSVFSHSSVEDTYAAGCDDDQDDDDLCNILLNTLISGM